jgi:phosphate transport system protein
MSEHTVKAFDAELNGLVRKIEDMGRLADEQIANSIGALTSHDAALARRIIAADADIDRLQLEIEEMAVLTIARRQPMARDLRELVGALRVANGLERIGDYAKNIAKRVIASGADAGPAADVRELQQMADLVTTALRNVIDAYVRRDAAKAMEVWRNDETIDAANNALFRRILADMMAAPRSIPACTHLMFCAKNMERIGDHATNIAETVYYIAHGNLPEAERPKHDTTRLADSN